MQLKDILSAVSSKQGARALAVASVLFATVHAVPSLAQAPSIPPRYVGQYTGPISLSNRLVFGTGTATMQLASNGSITGTTTLGCQFSGRISGGIYVSESQFSLQGPIVIAGCTDATLNLYNSEFGMSISTLSNGTGTTTATFDIHGNNSVGVVNANSTLLTKAVTTTSPVSEYTGAWALPTESGVGLTVIAGGSGSIGVVWYTFDPGRIPAWYFMTNGTWEGSTYTGQLIKFSGTAYNETWDQTKVGQSMAGTASLDFSSPSTMTFNYSVNGVTASKQFQKLAF